MPEDPKKISQFWKKEYSTLIPRYSKYQRTEQFEKIAALFTPGESYFYVLNMHDLELDYVSPMVTKFVGDATKEVKMDDLLKLALPEEVEPLQKKELVIKDFFSRYLHPSEITSYKLVYSYLMKDFRGNRRTMLHQATVLSQTENGFPQHVLSIHSDISHLASTSSKKVSFIHLGQGKSYYNLNVESGGFAPDSSSPEPDISTSLTGREKQIIDLLAKGFSAKQIADELHLSIHTVKTHRKNILAKCSCKNTAELIAESMIAGILH